MHEAYYRAGMSCLFTRNASLLILGEFLVLGVVKIVIMVASRLSVKMRVAKGNNRGKGSQGRPSSSTSLGDRLKRSKNAEKVNFWEKVDFGLSGKLFVYLVQGVQVRLVCSSVLVLKHWRLWGGVFDLLNIVISVAILGFYLTILVVFLVNLFFVLPKELTKDKKNSQGSLENAQVRTVASATTLALSAQNQSSGTKKGVKAGTPSSDRVPERIKTALNLQKYASKLRFQKTAVITITTNLAVPGIIIGLIAPSPTKLTLILAVILLIIAPVVFCLTQARKTKIHLLAISGTYLALCAVSGVLLAFETTPKSTKTENGATGLREKDRHSRIGYPLFLIILLLIVIELGLWVVAFIMKLSKSMDEKYKQNEANLGRGEIYKDGRRSGDVFGEDIEIPVEGVDAISGLEGVDRAKTVGAENEVLKRQRSSRIPYRSSMRFSVANSRLDLSRFGKGK